jgi:multicomponent Na+:H+ antiporter subunit G
VIADALGFVLVAAGVGFTLVGGVGMVRLPDFYARSHAATKPDTLGVILSLLGLAVLEGPTLTSVKLLLIMAFVALTNPAAIHALARSAVRSGLQPWTRRSRDRP